jgi:predicted ATPase/class 3 adenylate cyclase
LLKTALRPPLLGYQLGALLHRSAQHDIWEATRDADGSPVVIKTVGDEYPSRQNVAAVEREFAILKRLQPVRGVVRALDLQPWGHGNAALILEASGASLAEWMVQQATPRASPLQVLGYVAGIAETLAAVHERGVVHKNIHPRSVLVDASGAIRLIDFSIASELAIEQQEDLLVRLQGNLSHVSPEQTGRVNRELDYRSDFYSLGILMYELLTGVLPFCADSPLGWVHAHIGKAPRPPREIEPSIPPALAAVCLKLIEKNADERYQSCFGLLADLGRCRRELTQTGKMPPFELGRRDVSPRFSIPGKLYGREPEAAALRALFERVAAGGTEVVMITGHGGIGKSALVGELGEPLVRHEGLLIEGKFDQFQRNTPYGALAMALRGLACQWLAESEERQAVWRDRIMRAVAPNTQLLIELAPELEQVLGVQPSVAELTEVEAQNRFQFALVDFMRTVSAERPLVIFIDDLQFADAATLMPVGWLATARDLPRVLLIGAYRSNEVAPSLRLLLGEIAQSRSMHELALRPLTQESVQQLVTEALHSDRKACSPIAELLYARSQGNPFFLGEMLRSLIACKAISFAPEVGRWRWDLDAVLRSEVGVSAVDFVVTQLRELPEQTQRVLWLAACIGNRFDLHTLAAVCEQESVATARQLMPALQGHVVVPLSDIYKLVGNDSDSNIGEPLNPLYRFQHDHVQRAAYALIDERHRQVVHLSVGRLLQRHALDAPSSEQLIAIVGHLNAGRQGIHDPAERMMLMRLNLHAAQLVHRWSSYESALAYLRVGQELMPADPWSSEPALTRVLLTELQQCAYLTGRYDEAERWIDMLLEHAENDMERAELLAMCTRQYATTGKMDASMRAAFTGLALLGIPVCNAPDSVDIRRERTAVRRHLAGRRVADLIHAPPLTDPVQKLASRLLMEIFPAAFLSGSGNLFPFLVLRAVNISLRYGTGSESAFTYAAYGMLLCGTLDNPALGNEFGQLAVAMNERLDDSALKSRVIYLHAMFIHHWSNHWSTMTPWFRRGLEAGYRSGDLLYLAYNAQDCIIWDPTLDLEQAEREHAACMEVVRDTGYQDSFDSGSLFLQMQRNFLGRTRDALSMNDGAFDEARVVQGMHERGFMTGVANYHIYKAEICWLHGAPAEAFEHVRAMDGLLASAMSLPQLVRIYVVATLVLSHMLRNMPADQRGPIRARLRADLCRMRRWARICPANYLHLQYLMEAEAAREGGRGSAALRRYELAAEAAHAGGWRRDEAMAHECAARHLMDEGRPKAAEGYLRAACKLYERWGAGRKVQLLQDEFSWLAPPPWPLGVGALDLATVWQASHAISKETVLEQLWRTTMRLMLENAGGNRGCFVLREGGKLVIEGLCEFGSDAPVPCAHPVEATAQLLPVSVVYQTLHTQAPVVLHDIGSDTRFARDAYLLAHRPQSLLCVPLERLGKFEGVIYLENRLAAGVFTESRIEVLKLLGAQASISIENARLVAAQQRLIDAQRRFVPSGFLEILNRYDIARVDPGEHVAKVMSVMFSDLRGFAPIAERLDPGDVIGLLNRYFTDMGEAIAGAGGFIDSFAGDEIKALFDTTADTAVHAGVAMWRALDAFNARSRELCQPELNMGIGVSTGAVVLGTVGSADRLQCSVVGDTVNLASRIEQLTKRYGARLLVSGATVDTLRQPHEFALRQVDRVEVKGRLATVELYEVLDAETPARRDAKQATLPTLRAAMALYVARDFEAAEDAFGRMQDDDPLDQVPALFVQRCRYNRAEPPPADWQGVEKLTEK